MGADNKFLILNKSRPVIMGIKRIIEEVIQSDNNEDSDYRLSVQYINIEQYDKYYALEGLFRNSVMEDLWYWLDKKGKNRFIEDSFCLVRYENTDEVVLVSNINNTLVRDELFDAFGGRLYKSGSALEQELPMRKIKEFFCYVIYADNT